MKSAWCTRRLGTADAPGRRPSIIHRSTTPGAGLAVANLAAAAASGNVTCHCHCPPGHANPDDALETPSRRGCELCERLHGREDPRPGCADEPGRKSRLESFGLADQGGLAECGHVSEEGRALKGVEYAGASPGGSSSRCVSSVVRWTWDRVEMLRGRRSWTWQSRMLAWMILFLLVLPFPALAQYRTAVSSATEKGVCQSIDIRNNLQNFKKLEGCRIVEGFVQILLIDDAEPAQYANITFPELTEIAGYLMLYRVEGLQSVGRLFPNLAVIRGNVLFTNYALVVFEMMNLQEIGLHSLNTIIRGAVYFARNPVLCYVETIDWDLLAKAGKGEHLIVENSPRNECPICNRNCPARQSKTEETLCWNQQHCQQICEKKCENNACDSEGNCCHPSCLGTCSGPTNRDCVACRNVVTADGECMERCPSGTFEFMNRRCLEEDKCRQMLKRNSYKPFNGTCVIECPSGYMEEDVNGKPYCKKCKGLCLKKCAGASVDSIATAQKLRGCTHITGSLEIQIRGGKNIVKELEDNLSTIKEIDGYLKIVRSFSLISLNFLKNLRVIRGKDLDNNKYTLVVLDNQNLQELWDWNWHPDILILSKDGPAKVFFHFNPKLCLYKIEALREKAGLNPFTDLEVAPNSNGDKVACNVTELRTNVRINSPWGVVIEWEPFRHHDARSLLGYVVYFIEAPNRNVTMYDGRDACGGDGWKVDDVSASTTVTNRTVESHYLSQLKPYTQYAYYVKTYTIATERSGAQSNLTYFRTMPDAPSSPWALVTSSISSSELRISWQPPLQKNGNLTHYWIFGRWDRDDPPFINQRNYCEEPMLLPDKKALSVEEEEKKRAEEEKEQTTIPETGTCECTTRKTDQSIREKEVSSAIAFEDALHNQVYVKRKIPSRKKRNAGDGRRTVSVDADEQSIQDKMENGKYTVFRKRIPSANHSFVMGSLQHFAAYNIEVRACRAQEGNETYRKCSTKTMRTHRTLPLAGADNIPSDTFKVNVSGENNSLTMVTLSWDEPADPNGLIVTYQIEYERVDIQSIKPTVVCITRQDFLKAGNSYLLKGLPSGNYLVKVRATSLAGYGDYTSAKSFSIMKQQALGAFWVVFWSLLCILIVILGSVAFFYVYKRRLASSVPNVTLIAAVNPEYVSTPYVLDEWEVPREKIKLLHSLGNGSFGMVYEGVARDIVKGKPEVRCAVKTVNKDATDRERIEFLNEASVMKSFDAHHVVKLLGVVTQGQPTLVIMELMINGDLKTYLRTHRPGVCDHLTNKPPRLERILQMAIEIADGMAYLATKKFVHRDLAARNCMVADDLTVKVGDFGMTRDIYERDYYRKGCKGLLPVRWMAPESLQDGVFSSSSDVWSYGVVLWEMVTFASQPYQGLSNDEVLTHVIQGGVMERPENCPELLYELMQRTWKRKETARPTFLEIVALLLNHVELEPFEQVSFYHSPEGIEARNQNRSNSPQTDKYLQDDELEGDEDSPLRQDSGDSLSGESISIKNSLSPRNKMNSYGENSKAASNCYDIKSVKSSPFISMKGSSRGNSSQLSLDKSGSPKNHGKRGFLGNLNLTKRTNADYENRSSEIMSGAEKRETVPLRVDFEKKDSAATAEYVNKPETLNNGYIGGTTT